MVSHTFFHNLAGIRNSFSFLCRKFKNRILYGPEAPKPNEIIWIYPRDCLKIINDMDIRKELKGRAAAYSGLIVDTSWPFDLAIPIFDNVVIEEGRNSQRRKIYRIQCCISHWSQGIPWEETGIYDHMEYFISERGSDDGCFTKEDVINRYEMLDLVFEETKKEGRLNPEYGVGRIHIGPAGELYNGGGANHRFAIAYILNIPYPARIGIIHKDAIRFLHNYRSEPKKNEGKKPGYVR